jgi:hypothetical protein
MTKDERIQSLFEEIRYGFFGHAIADIYKAIKGQSYIGAFTLSMCTISALAEIEWSNNNQDLVDNDGNFTISRNKLISGYNKMDKTIFQDWLKRWIVDTGINSQLDVGMLYVLRNILVHSYGATDLLNTSDSTNYLFMRDEPHLHCDNTNRIYKLNLESLVAEITLGADQFFTEMKNDWNRKLEKGFEHRVKGLITEVSFDDSGKAQSRIINKLSLNFVDARLCEYPLRVSKLEIIKMIHAFYDADNNCKCDNKISSNLLIESGSSGQRENFN